MTSFSNYIKKLTATSVLLILFSSAFAHQATRPAELSTSIEVIEGNVNKGIKLELEMETVQEFSKGRMTVKTERLGKSAFEDKVESTEKREVRAGEKMLSIDLSISEQGRYRTTILLEGETGKKDGFSAKVIRYIDVKSNGDYIIRSRKQLRKDQRGQREELFKKALAENPQDPDITLLSADVEDVPREFEDKIAPSREGFINAHPSELSDIEKRYVKENSDKSWAPEDPITIRGRITFVDWDGVAKPLVNAQVDVYDDDTLGDEHLTSLVTGGDGRWEVSLNNDDGWLQNGRDIYYKFKTSNSRFKVEDCDGIDSTYSWKSETFDDRNEGAVIDFGTDTAGSDSDTLIVFNMLNDAWIHSVNVGQRDPGMVETCYPEDGTFWSRFWEEISFEDQFIDGPNVLHHEYAHAIMWFGQGNENSSPGGAHSFNDVNQDSGLAFSEGWANAFQNSVRPDGVLHFNEGSPGVSLEGFRNGNANRNGNLHEGRVAAALIDMMDSTNDTNGGNQDLGRDDYGDDNTANRVSLATIMNETLWGNYHDDFEEFWGTLSGNLDSTTRLKAQEIMYYNWMDVPEPATCVATKVAAELSEEPEQFLTGLRKFRDLALSEYGGGRRLTQSYYRNSPEIAMALIRDPELRNEAFEIAKIFSGFGFDLASNQRLKKLVATGRPIIDRELADRMRKLSDTLKEKASPDLDTALNRMDEIVRTIEGMNYIDIQEKIAQNQSSRVDHNKVQFRQLELSPASQKAAQSPELRKILQLVEPPKDLQ